MATTPIVNGPRTPTNVAAYIDKSISAEMLMAVKSRMFDLTPAEMAKVRVIREQCDSIIKNTPDLAEIAMAWACTERWDNYNQALVAGTIAP